MEGYCYANLVEKSCRNELRTHCGKNPTLESVWKVIDRRKLRWNSVKELIFKEGSIGHIEVRKVNSTYRMFDGEGMFNYLADNFRRDYRIGYSYQELQHDASTLTVIFMTIAFAMYYLLRNVNVANDDGYCYTALFDNIPSEYVEKLGKSPRLSSLVKYIVAMDSKGTFKLEIKGYLIHVVERDKGSSLSEIKAILEALNESKIEFYVGVTTRSGLSTDREGTQDIPIPNSFTKSYVVMFSICMVFMLRLFYAYENGSLLQLYELLSTNTVNTPDLAREVEIEKENTPKYEKESVDKALKIEEFESRIKGYDGDYGQFLRDIETLEEWNEVAFEVKRASCWRNVGALFGMKRNAFIPKVSSMNQLRLLYEYTRQFNRYNTIGKVIINSFYLEKHKEGYALVIGPTNIKVSNSNELDEFDMYLPLYTGN